MIECVGTGLVYRNPKPHLRAVHAWHPSLALLDDGHVLCAFDLGQAVESLDYRTWLSESNDGGQTWSAPGRLFDDDTERRHTHTMRINNIAGGKVVGFGARFYRDDSEQGLTNRQNMGFVPMDLILAGGRANENGPPWETPTVIAPPLEGPAFEVCHAILELDDGRWLAPTQTWRGWDGRSPHGMKAIALVSHDHGRTWPDYIDVMDGNNDGLIYFEQSVAQLTDGRLLATAWAYHEATGESRPVPYAVSEDGKCFTPPRSTGLQGQTTKLLVLPDGRILCLYRRQDKPGLWANLARLDGDTWVNLEEASVWKGPMENNGRAASSSEMLGTLKLGFPQLKRLPDGNILAVFWCHEDEVNHIRWTKLLVT